MSKMQAIKAFMLIMRGIFLILQAVLTTSEEHTAFYELHHDYLVFAQGMVDNESQTHKG